MLDFAGRVAIAVVSAIVGALLVGLVASAIVFALLRR